MEARHLYSLLSPPSLFLLPLSFSLLRRSRRSVRGRPNLDHGSLESPFSFFSPPFPFSSASEIDRA